MLQRHPDHKSVCSPLVRARKRAKRELNTINNDNIYHFIYHKYFIIIKRETKIWFILENMSTIFNYFLPLHEKMNLLIFANSKYDIY